MTKLVPRGGTAQEAAIMELIHKAGGVGIFVAFDKRFVL